MGIADFDMEHGRRVVFYRVLSCRGDCVGIAWYKFNAMSDLQAQLEKILISMRAQKEAPRRMGRLPAGISNENRQIVKKAIKKRKKR